MVVRKVSKEGRVSLPVELMEKTNIKPLDLVEITSEQNTILIRKYQPQHVCAVTGKVSSELIKVGKIYLSKEAIEMIQKIKT